ncbi:hypothetical protein GGD62_005768 [Bradyrhizobium sp. ERR14]|nr:hypothetical protein [Bradyrhizobium sp. ERR14]
MGQPCCGLRPRTEWHQDDTRDPPNTRAAYPSPGAYTTKPRRLPFQISLAQTHAHTPGLVGDSPHVIAVKRTTRERPPVAAWVMTIRSLSERGGGTTNEIWCSADVRKATTELASTTTLVAPPKEASGSCAVCSNDTGSFYAADIELNSVAPLSRSQKKQDQVSFEQILTRLYGEMSSLLLKPSAALPMVTATKHSQIAPPLLTSTRPSRFTGDFCSSTA